MLTNKLQTFEARRVERENVDGIARIDADKEKRFNLMAMLTNPRLGQRVTDNGVEVEGGVIIHIHGAGDLLPGDYIREKNTEKWYKVTSVSARAGQIVRAEAVSTWS